MSENGADAPEVVQFEPKRQPRSYDTPVEEAGQAIVANVRRAAELANETCDRAMRLAHKLSLELRAAEDRINQLEAEVQLFRDRADRDLRRTPNLGTNPSVAPTFVVPLRVLEAPKRGRKSIRGGRAHQHLGDLGKGRSR
jgi:hypothetical protein